jgi:HD-GYP domain-containing protein (c-di-GMP phosphodiesterase class II)
MKINPLNTEVDTSIAGGNEGELRDRFCRSLSIMIPIELDRRRQSIGYFELKNLELPAGGQKNINEITGQPYHPELAGLTVYIGPIQPELQENYVKALVMLAESIDRCDQSGHSESTSLWAVRLAQRMGLPQEEITQIKLAGKLHDIGKSVVPRDLLIKPGPLTSEEWDIMKRHPAYGVALMESSVVFVFISLMVRWHHERYDGKGYPDKIGGTEIPVSARILAAADAFSTMTNGRPYRDPMPFIAALQELVRCRGTQFDPEIVDNMVGLCLEIDI